MKDIAAESFYATVGFPLKTEGEVPAFLTYLDGERMAVLENHSGDLTLTTGAALMEMIDYLVREHGLTHEQACVPCGLTAGLVVGEVVDVPNDTVSAVLDHEVLAKG